MKLVTLTEKEYNDFAIKHPLISVYQLKEWGELKKDNGWISHLVGLKNKNKVVCATLLLEKKTRIKKSIFYAPRGFLIDFKDYKLLKNFVEELKIYLKNHQAIFLKIDPNYIYQIRDNDGNEINQKDDKTINYLKELGFKHTGFSQNFETMQPRWLCRFKVLKNYDETFQTFNKSTKKNILEALKNVEIKKATLKDIPIMMDMLEETANRKHFGLRVQSYYENMFKLLEKYSVIYIAYIKPLKYLSNLQEKWIDESRIKEEIEKKMAKEKVGQKLTRDLEIQTNKLSKLKEEIKYAKELTTKGEIINIGALYSIYIGNEGITFMSGINDEYRKFNPKYIMYNEHLKETIKRKLEYVNFYGISGIFDKNNPNYKIYELKKGFNTEVIELIGEFNLVINKFSYLIYNLALKIYNLKK